MKTLLIPIDFSDVTENVIRYAADFSCDTHIERIILLKSFHVSAYAQLLPSTDFVQLSEEVIQQEKQKAEANLLAFRSELLKKCNPSIGIVTAMSELPLLRAIHEIIALQSPYMLMIGSSIDMSESYISEQVIAIAKLSTVPVLIVPSTVKYEKIELALVPCDFSAIPRLSALEGFRDPTKFLHPELMILNVAPKQKHLENNGDLAKLEEFLKGYEYKVYYSDDKDIVHGILNFAGKHSAQIIMALPGKYSFFYNLTHRSITKALALNESRPVLILK